jgi:hypothetical protein
VIISVGLLSCLAFYDIDNKPETETVSWIAIAPQKRELYTLRQKSIKNIKCIVGWMY